MFKKFAIFLLLAACFGKPSSYEDIDWDDVFSDEELNYCDFYYDPDCEDYPSYYY